MRIEKFKELIKEKCYQEQLEAKGMENNLYEIKREIKKIQKEKRNENRLESYFL